MKIEIQIPNEEDRKRAQDEIDAGKESGVLCWGSFIAEIAKKYNGKIVVKHFKGDIHPGLSDLIN